MSAIGWAGELDLPAATGERPIYNKSSNNGKTILQNWPDSTIGTDTEKIQLAVATGPTGVGTDPVYVMTTTPTVARRDLFHWSGIQSVGTNPDWTGSPFRNGTDWWFSWEFFLPSTDVTAGGVNMGHWDTSHENANWLWQMHQDNIIQNGSPAYTQAPSGVAIDYNAGTPFLWFRFIGGNMDFATGGTDVNFASDAGNTWCSYQQATPNVLLDHWYRIVFHCRFDNDPSVGYWQVWMDGSQIIDMTGANVISGWTKKKINTSGSTVTVTTESFMATNYYRITTTDSQGHTGSSGNQYPGIDNYHTANALTSCALHREWKADDTLAGVGGI